MFRHVVMFRWNDDVDEAHIAVVSAALDGLPATIPQIRRYHHGPDARVNDQNFDYVVVADFDSADDYLVYRDDPAHRTLVADLVAGRIVERAAVQYHTAEAVTGEAD